MPELERRLPSIPEVLELVSLIPPVKPPRPNIVRLLQPFIDICRPQWISDFLFTPEPIHLEHFLSPTFSSKAFVCAFKATRIEAAGLQPDPEPLYEETHHLDGRNLFLPAFTVGDITLGFGVMEIMANSGPFWFTDRRCGACLPLRFVRDRRNKTFLEMFDIPQDDGVMVFLTQYLSPTHTHSVWAMFTRSKLLESLREEGSGREFVDKLTHSLRFIMEEDQGRGCQVCTVGECLCAVRAAAGPAQHPFDGRGFGNAMMEHLGVRQSLSSKMLFENGRDRHVVLGCRTTMQGSIDPGFVQRVCAWVATDYLKVAGARPGRSMPLVSDFVEALGDIFTFGEDKLRIVGAENEVGDEEMLQRMLNEVIEEGEGETVVDGGIDMSGEGVGLEVAGVNGGYLLTVEGGAEGAEGGNGDVQEEWWASRCEISEESSGQQSNNWDKVFADGLLVGGEEGGGGGGGGDGGGAESKTGEGVEEEETEAEKRIRERRARMQRRREKNRECAARSNARVKRIRDGLKKELGESKQQMEALREREMRLRRDNVQLRKAVAAGRRSGAALL